MEITITGSALLLTLILIIYVAARWDGKKRTILYPENKEPLSLLYPMAAFVLIKMQGTKWFSRKRRDEIKRFERLYPEKSGENEHWFFNLRRASLILLLVIAVSAFSLLAGIKDIQKGYLEAGATLKRPEAGDGKALLNYFSSEKIKGELTVKIRPPKKSGNELEQYLEELKKIAEKQMLNENESADCITSSLGFADTVSGFPVKWIAEASCVGSSGQINNEGLPEEGILTTVTARIDYYSDIVEFQYPLRLLPRTWTSEEQFSKAVREAVKKAEEESLYKDQILLPDQIGESKIVWEEEKNNTSVSILGLGALSVIVLYIGMDQDIKKKEKNRRRQMMIDYTDIVGKLTLLLSAGMTIRGAWGRILEDYSKRRRKTAARFAYEEMLLTSHELEIGISEASAYENFGKRCGVQAYMKLSTILVQNLKKGTKNFLPLLEQETISAVNERRDLAKRLGEEAGTKMLGPMFLLLVIVLGIVLIPAFGSFY